MMLQFHKVFVVQQLEMINNLDHRRYQHQAPCSPKVKTRKTSKFSPNPSTHSLIFNEAIEFLQPLSSLIKHEEFASISIKFLSYKFDFVCGSWKKTSDVCKLELGSYLGYIGIFKLIRVLIFAASVARIKWLRLRFDLASVGEAKHSARVRCRSRFSDISLHVGKSEHIPPPPSSRVSTHFVFREIQ